MQTSSSSDALLAVPFLGAAVLSLVLYEKHPFGFFGLFIYFFAVVSFLFALSGLRSKQKRFKGLAGFTIFLLLAFFFVLFAPIPI